MNLPRRLMSGPHGINLLVDGDCEADGVTAWTATYGTASKDSGAHSGVQCLKYDDTGVNNASVTQIGFADAVYHVTGFARSDGTLWPYASITGNIDWLGTTSTDWQAIDFTLQKGALFGGNVAFGKYGSGAGTVWFDDMRVVMVG